MKELKQVLLQFKHVTVELIRALQQDELYKLDDLLNSRQIVIESMEKSTYTTEQFADICNELDILSMNQRLSELMLITKENTKEELNKIQVTKNANSNYNKSFYANSCTFDKQI